MKIKTQQDLWESITLIEKIDVILAEYGIPSKSKYPYKDWIGLIAWECKTNIEEIENELKKVYNT